MMTPEGRAFVERVELCQRMVDGGNQPFPSMAASFESTDWLLVYAAVCEMARRIKEQ